MYSFQNDYSEGAHPNILRALETINYHQNNSYGLDEHSNAARELIQEALEDYSADIHFISGGTLTNLTFISHVLKPYEAVISAQTGHINTHETGAIEATGHKVFSISTEDGKLTPDLIRPVLDLHENEHWVEPRLVYISNPTEIGTVYTKEELEVLYGFCQRHHLYLYMDGARLANACAALNLGFRELTVDCGIDILSFGGTKNGLMLGESVVVFNPALKKEAYFVRKQSAQLASKLRYLSCQFTAYLTDSLWLKNAAHANRMAKILYDGLKELPGVHFTQKVESNQLFLTMPRPVIDELLKDYFFYFWDEAIHEIRFVTSFDTTEEDIEQLLQSVKRLL